MNEEKIKVWDGYVPIAIAFTANYYIPAAVTIQSVIANSAIDEKFHFICMVSYNISELQKQKLRMMDGGIGRIRFSFVDLQNVLKDIYVIEHFTVAASFRLLLPQILPDYKKVIYLDCDVIVRANLSYLYYSVDLKNNYLAGVRELVSKFHIDNVPKECDINNYINSGVLLMNLEQLRKDNMVSKFVEASKCDKYVCPDQDILNIYCRDRIYFLPPYYNGIVVFNNKQEFLKKYTEEDYNAYKNYGTIHYISNKPWNSIAHQYFLWWKNYDLLSPELKKEWKMDFSTRWVYATYRCHLLYLIYKSPSILMNRMYRIYGFIFK